MLWGFPNHNIPAIWMWTKGLRLVLTQFAICFHSHYLCEHGIFEGAKLCKGHVSSRRPSDVMFLSSETYRLFIRSESNEDLFEIDFWKRLQIDCCFLKMNRLISFRKTLWQPHSNIFRPYKVWRWLWHSLRDLTRRLSFKKLTQGWNHEPFLDRSMGISMLAVHVVDLQSPEANPWSVGARMSSVARLEHTSPSAWNSVPKMKRS